MKEDCRGGSKSFWPHFELAHFEIFALQKSRPIPAIVNADCQGADIKHVS